MTKLLGVPKPPKERQFTFTTPKGKRVLFSGTTHASAKIEFEAWLVKDKGRDLKEAVVVRKQKIEAAEVAARKVKKANDEEESRPSENLRRTKDGFLKERCAECRVSVCLKPITKNRYTICDVTLLNTEGSPHVCKGGGAENDAPVGLSGGGFETNRRRH